MLSVLEKRRRYRMCDFSLEAYLSRLAKEGETLVVHRFPTTTVGMVSAEDFNRIHCPKERGRFAAIRDFWTGGSRGMGNSPPCAVCIPPGARMAISGYKRVSWVKLAFSE